MFGSQETGMMNSQSGIAKGEGPIRNLFFVYGLIGIVLIVQSVVCYGTVYRFNAQDLQLSINDRGKVLSVTDRRTGKEFLDTTAASNFAVAHTASNRVFADRFQLLTDTTVRITFSPLKADLILSVKQLPFGLYLEILSCTSSEIERIDLFNILLDIDRKPSAAFGACLTALSVNILVPQNPVLQDRLQCSVFKNIGMDSASVLLIGSSPNTILMTLRKYLPAFPGLPTSPFGGAHAETSAYAHGSYLFSYGSLNGTNFSRWKEFAQPAGFSQIQFHGGTAHSFRFGDLAVDTMVWPNGWNSVRAVVDSLHSSGMQATLHTYSFLIGRDALEDRRFAMDDLSEAGAFTLERAVSVKDTVILLTASSGKPPAVGSVIRFDQELCVVVSVESVPSSISVRCVRGAYGSERTSHASGSPGSVLREIYGCLMPRPGSPLFYAIARRHAEVINQTGFDGVYLDGIDAIERLEPQNGWYWATQFILELWKHLDRPVGMDMGHMYHHFWRLRSRWEAWDTPMKGYQNAIDAHCEWNETGTMLPQHLGWWDWDPDSSSLQRTRESREDFEYLLARAVEKRSGISFVGEPPFNELFNGDLRWKWDLLKRFAHKDAHGYSAVRLRTIREERAKRRKAEVAAGIFSDVSNQRGSSKGKIPLLDVLLKEARPQSIRPDKTDDVRPVFGGNGFMVRKKLREEWEGISFRFDRDIDLQQSPALGMWIVGDSSNTVMLVRLENDYSVSPHVFDRFIKIDFIGLRYVVLSTPNFSQADGIRWPLQQEASWRFYRGEIDLRKIRTISFILGGRSIAGHVRIDSLSAFSTDPSE